MTDGSATLRLGVIGAGAWAAAAHIPGFLRRPEIVPWIEAMGAPSAPTNEQLRELGLRVLPRD